MASMKEFRTSALRELVDNLQRALDLSKSALNTRDKLVDIQGSNNLAIAEDLSKKDPEEYYYFKFLDKAISIVYDMYHFNENRRVRGSVYLYHIKLYGFDLLEINDFMKYAKKYGKSLVLDGSNGFNISYIGDFQDLSSCIHTWKYVIYMYLSYCGFTSYLNWEL